MPRITISYRRDDSDVITGRIFDRLTAHFGRETVFRDIDSIPLGVDFRKHVDSVIDGTDLMVAVVGPKWIGPRAGQSRLDNAADPVRVEIDAALRKGVPLIPVLVLRAQMPRADQLPPSLEDFAYRNAARIDAGQDFDTHMARLIRAIDNVLGDNTRSATAPDVVTATVTPLAAQSVADEQDEQRRFAQQLQREEEARQRQVEEDHQRELAEARRRDEEERKETERREREERERREAAARQATEQRECEERERREAAARQATEQREREERERREAAARQAAEQREREERERQEAAARHVVEQREREERERLEVAARAVAAASERQEMAREGAEPPHAGKPTAATPPSRPATKRKVVLGFGAAALIIVVIATVVVISRPGPTPPPVPTPSPAPTPPPQAQNDPPPVSTFLAPGQLWSISFSDQDHHRYNATLAVTQSVSFNSFTGRVDVAYKESDGTDKVVREDALVTINEPKITISCSNATVIKGNGSYTADYFDLTIKSRTEAEGTSLDDKELVPGATMRRN
jgi:hypothetical protein